MANHLEVRVPFLDKHFLAVAMGMEPSWKRPQSVTPGSPPVEKWVLRKAFDNQVLENLHFFIKNHKKKYIQE
jgi:asparagine synthase (glutamine-hydrolysing)